mmetsp:Transcript_68320/g.181988  ORF Transcript_68320/g.181988 Transcript_68320/m.181988 type:complete len:202 (-) Transcript_68320:304-909(-)
MGNGRSSPMLVIGLDSAGKTTLMHHLAQGKVSASMPTIGFSQEHAEFQGFAVTSFDVGGRCPIRPLYRFFLKDARPVIMMVVDSSDPERLDDVKRELKWFADEDTMAEGIFVILQNKMDLTGAGPVDEVASVLKPTQRYAIFPTCTTTMRGVQDALDWVKSVQKEDAAPSKPSGDEKQPLAPEEPSASFASVLRSFMKRVL